MRLEGTSIQTQEADSKKGACGPTLERHRHEHVVVGVRGRGTCKVKRKSYEIEVMDTLYIPPDAPHQLKNPYREPFGFFCIVDAKRDRPRPV